MVERAKSEHWIGAKVQDIMAKPSDNQKHDLNNKIDQLLWDITTAIKELATPMADIDALNADGPDDSQAKLKSLHTELEGVSAKATYFYDGGRSLANQARPPRRLGRYRASSGMQRESWQANWWQEGAGRTLRRSP